ncbi:MAG TPA: SDR family NAD(P)-dependent oxidoreductase [Sedimentibacter sp.]|nr:SDR family NAD(P)-dependent oxidoreductase [Sedimentibacter sp.]
MDIDISDKVILITGASRGIGKRVAFILAKEGASVIINYNKSWSEASHLLEEISVFNNKCMIIQCDVSKVIAVENMYKQIVIKYGHLDLLINNAGISEDNSSYEMSEAIWKKVIDTNLTGCFLCSKEYIKLMKKNNRGKILNIASLKGQEGSYRQCNYATSKAGVIAFTKSLAMEMGEHNILINAICPGYIQTDLNCSKEYKEINAQRRSAIKEKYAIDDLVNFIIWYASDFLKGVSGQVFNLDSRIINEYIFEKM